MQNNISNISVLFSLLKKEPHSIVNPQKSDAMTLAPVNQEKSINAVAWKKI